MRYSHILKHTINQLFTTIFNIYIYTYTITYNDYDIKLTTYHRLFTIFCHNYIHWFRIIFSFLSIYLSIYPSIHLSIHPSNHPSILYKGHWICLWGFVSHHHLISWRWTIPLVHPIPSWGHSGQAARCPARQTSCRAPRPFKLLQATSLTKGMLKAGAAVLGAVQHHRIWWGHDGVMSYSPSTTQWWNMGLPMSTMVYWLFMLQSQ